MSEKVKNSWVFLHFKAMKFAVDAEFFARRGKPDLARLAYEEAAILEGRALAALDAERAPRTFRVTLRSFEALKEKAGMTP